MGEENTNSYALEKVHSEKTTIRSSRRSWTRPEWVLHEIKKNFQKGERFISVLVSTVLQSWERKNFLGVSYSPGGCAAL